MGFGVFALIVAIIFNSLGNIFLKFGADRGISFSFDGGIGAWLAGHAFLIAGVIFFAVNVLFYTIALRALPLSVAYPVMVGSVFFAVGIVASLTLHEYISTIQIVGYGLILIGIVLVSAFSAGI